MNPLRYRLLIVVAALSLTLGLWPNQPAAAAAGPTRDFFGVVGRDPWYEYSVDPATNNGEPNRVFLEHMCQTLSQAGAGWLRVEFHAEYDQTTGPGYINWDKYDWFINECAPKYGLKVLALLNSGILSDTDPLFRVTSLEDPSDKSEGDPVAGTNHYIRTFVNRAAEIVDRYRGRIAAYEIMNEPNVSAELGMLTSPMRQEINPERYGALITTAFTRVKELDPNAKVILAGLLYASPIENPNRTPVDYLSDVYASSAVQRYYKTAPHPNGNPFPFDGVASHPFSDSPSLVEDHLRQLHQKMLDWGDVYNQIWVTEIGLEASPPSDWNGPPTVEEIRQAEYLTDVYDLAWNNLNGIVARVFWFKYEDFEGSGARENWGLVRLVEYGWNRYSPGGDIAFRKLAFTAFSAMANPAGLPTAPQSAPRPGAFYFAESGHSISPLFQRYWEQNGGLAEFGYPLTEEFESLGLQVQYFQRARFEYHPGSATPIELTQLGRILTSNLDFPTIQPFASDSYRVYFPETGHSLSFGFLSYWKEHGGLATFGYPISEEIQEVSPGDSVKRTVQYFERARFEYHPELQGTANEIQLGLLGSQALQLNDWYR
jgi:hypothetical protein